MVGLFVYNFILKGYMIMHEGEDMILHISHVFSSTALFRIDAGTEP